MRTIAAAPAAILALAALLAVAAGWWFWRRKRPSAEARERKRRLAIHSSGRVTDAMILEARDSVVFYSYTVRGVQYSASQDVAGLGDVLPANPALCIGPGAVKYSPANPANSIVLCEQWSGLRRYTQPSQDQEHRKEQVQK